MAAWSYFQHVFQLSVCYVVGRTSLPPVCVDSQKKQWKNCLSAFVGTNNWIIKRCTVNIKWNLTPKYRLLQGETKAKSKLMYSGKTEKGRIRDYIFAQQTGLHSLLKEKLLQWFGSVIKMDMPRTLRRTLVLLVLYRVSQKNGWFSKLHSWLNWFI
jgi:hypothetical protein